MTWSELEKKVKKAGNKFHRHGKKHDIWLNPKTGEKFEIARHRTQEVPKGTLDSIKTKARLD